LLSREGNSTGIEWRFLNIIQHLATKKLKTLSDADRKTFVFK
jgi:hypothetical protein